jgi:ribonuclease-3
VHFLIGLEGRLNHSFKNKKLLETALTHSSYANENKRKGTECNERLEFLGDAILGAAVAEHLFTTYPQMPEGDMTRLRAELVCEQSLYEVAAALKLGFHIRLGKGEEATGGRQRSSILADAAEAVLAAVYLDGGDWKSLIKRLILNQVQHGERAQLHDYKTALQENVQRDYGKLSYEITAESGPDHNKMFTARVLINGTPVAEGSGHTKKEAEQEAARHALKEMRHDT